MRPWSGSWFLSFLVGRTRFSDPNISRFDFLSIFESFMKLQRQITKGICAKDLKIIAENHNRALCWLYTGKLTCAKQQSSEVTRSPVRNYRLCSERDSWQQEIHMWLQKLWQWPTQRSPTSVKWRPGLTGKRVGVTTPQKKNLLCWWSFLFWQGVHKPTVMDNVQCIKSWDGLRIKRKTRDNTHKLLMVWIHKVRISESSDSEQHDESDREAKKGDTQARDTRKKTNSTRRGSGRYRSSSVAPDSIQFFFLSYEEFVLNRPHPL